MSKTITRLPALAFPLNTARILAVIVPFIITASYDAAGLPVAPYWFTTERSSFEQQRAAFTVETVLKLTTVPLVCSYIMLSSSGIVLVPVCMFYTAYTLGGTNSERAHTKYI
jgi:hypothetical protein